MLSWGSIGFVIVWLFDLSIWLHIGGIAVLALCVLRIAIGWRSMTKAVVRAKGRLCGNCLFTLEGLPMQGDCPECGRGYSIKHTIACWKHDLGLNGMYEYRHWPELPKDDSP